ncbi:MAG: hypothetical protein ACK5HJ_05215 [Bacteroidota bacterium]|jgi:hypothetical protein
MPKLNNTNLHNDGFSVPTDYMNTLENKILQRTVLIHDGYSVPEGYFTQLANRVLLRTVNARTPFVRPTALRVYAKYAAAAAVILVSSVVFYRYQQPTDFNKALHSTDEAVLIEYIEEYGQNDDVYYIPSDEIIADEELPYLLFES